MADDAGPPITFELIVTEIDVSFLNLLEIQKVEDCRNYLRGYLRGLRNANAITPAQWDGLRIFVNECYLDQLSMIQEGGMNANTNGR